MMHFVGVALAFVGGVFVIFMVSVFHAAALEVSRKPRLAIVTNDAIVPIEAAEEPEFAVAA